MSKAVAFVVEDQPNIAMLYEDSLRLIGFDVVRIANGIDAINKIELSEAPTMIVLDVNLPGASGRDVWQHIRRHPKYREVPVVIATANTLMAARLEPDLGPHDQVLIKPVSLKTLQDIAKRIKKEAAAKSGSALATDTQEAVTPQKPTVPAATKPEPLFPQKPPLPDAAAISESIKDLLDTQEIPTFEEITGDAQDLLATQRIPDFSEIEADLEEEQDSRSLYRIDPDKGTSRQK